MVVLEHGCVSGAWRVSKIEVRLVRKRSDLEIKFDTFMANHWLHMVKEVSFIKGELKILLLLVSCLMAGMIGILLNEVLQ